MRKPPSLEFTRQALRTRICAHCPSRPPGSENWSSERPRDCEARCRLFQHLPLLRETAKQLDPMLASHQHVLAKRIEQIKRKSAKTSAADRIDGLTRQKKPVIDTLIKLFNQ